MRDAPKFALEGNMVRVLSVAIASQSSLLAAGGGNPYDLSQAGMAKVWDIASGKELLRIERKGGPVFSVGFEPKTNMVALGSADGTVEIWSTATWKQLASFPHGDLVSCVAFQPGQALVASAGKDNAVKIWDIAKSKQLATLSHQAPVTCLSFSSDGKWLASGTEKGDDSAELKLWEAGTWKEAGAFQPPTKAGVPLTLGTFLSLAFGIDGSILFTGGERAEMRSLNAWDVASRQWKPLSFRDKQGAVFGDAGKSLAISPKGTSLAAALAILVVLFDPNNGNEQTDTPDYMTPSSLAFANDGKQLAVGTNNEGLITPGEVRLWSVSSD